MTAALWRLVILVATSLLASGCITVADFGSYWDSDRLDDDLAGRWVAVKTPDGDSGEVEYRRPEQGPASVDITTLDQPALEWLSRLERRSQPTSVFARRRR